MSSVLFAWHNDSDSISEFELALKLAQDSRASSLLILACQDNKFTAQQVNPLLSICSLPIFGGIYPKLIYKNKLMEKGYIIIGFQQQVEISLINQVSKLTTDDQLIEAIELTLLMSAQVSKNDGLLMFYDALINNTENFIDCLFECLDYQTSISGGGAGNLEFKKAPCLFTNQGLIDDAIQIVSLKNKMITAATHGWQVLKGPFLVSEVDKQTVMSLDYQPAFTVYKDEIESISALKLEENNFFKIAKNYPLGIQGINNQLIVRDPILTQNGYLQCVGSIPINSMVYLLEGSADSLISAAKEAALKATMQIGNNDFTATIVFDCISRALYLGNKFNLELDSIAEHTSTQALFGVVCFGEITNSESGAIKLLNKSTVMASW
ncbi:FIST C-terminal domain-containing protein [Pseudoalteromonas aliena]|uniref:FIST signal transduction protein n=1 Tax=Pseudoalteromonas aliena TaxID=247523 RepID=UPI00311FB35C